MGGLRGELVPPEGAAWARSAAFSAGNARPEEYHTRVSSWEREKYIINY